MGIFASKIQAAAAAATNAVRGVPVATPLADVGAQLPIFHRTTARIGPDGQFTWNRLQPESIEGLGDEFSLVLERCCREEKSIDADECLADMNLIGWYDAIDEALEEGSVTKNDEATAMLHHFRKCIATPGNLELLLRLILVRSDQGGRCEAIRLLRRLFPYIIGRPLMDKNLSNGKRFSSNLITTCLRYLQQDHKRQRVGGCDCDYDVRWLIIDALKFTKEQPLQLFNEIHSYAWREIVEFQYRDCDCDCCGTTLSMKLFNELVRIPGRVLLLEDPAPENDQSKAEAMLRDLGSAHGLFRSVLERIASKEFSWLKRDVSGISPPGCQEVEASNLSHTFTFLANFMAIAPSLNGDAQMMKQLTKRAHQTLVKKRSQIERWADATALEIYNLLILCFAKGKWSQFKNQSQEERWNHFLQVISPILTANKRKGIKCHYRSQIDEAHFCANCFKLEKDLPEGDKKLSKCGHCGLVNYCGGDCQKEHWGKGHRAKCKPNDAA